MSYSEYVTSDDHFEDPLEKLARANRFTLARLYGETNTNYWYVVKSEYFDVDQEAHAALTDDMQVRLYYTPKSRLLLSIEPKLGSDAGDKASRAASQP